MKDVMVNVNKSKDLLGIPESTRSSTYAKELRHEDSEFHHMVDAASGAIRNKDRLNQSNDKGRSKLKNEQQIKHANGSKNADTKREVKVTKTNQSEKKSKSDFDGDNNEKINDKQVAANQERDDQVSVSEVKNQNLQNGQESIDDNKVEAEQVDPEITLVFSDPRELMNAITSIIQSLDSVSATIYEAQGQNEEETLKESNAVGQAGQNELNNAALDLLVDTSISQQDPVQDVLNKVSALLNQQKPEVLQDVMPLLTEQLKQMVAANEGEHLHFDQLDQLENKVQDNDDYALKSESLFKLIHDVIDSQFGKDSVSLSSRSIALDFELNPKHTDKSLPQVSERQMFSPKELGATTSFNAEVAKVARNVAVNSRANETKSIHQQVSESMTFMVRGDKSRMELRLDPPEWGTVNIRMEIVKGEVKLTLMTEQHFVKQALERHWDDLRNTLNQAGMNLGSLDVQVGGQNLNQQNFEEKTYEDGNEGLLIKPIANKIKTKFRPSSNNIVDDIV